MWGWCKSREDYRLFKLNRMDKVHMSENYFSERIAPFPDLREERIFPGGIAGTQSDKRRITTKYSANEKKYDNAMDG